MNVIIHILPALLVPQAQTTGKDDNSSASESFKKDHYLSMMGYLYFTSQIRTQKSEENSSTEYQQLPLIKVSKQDPVNLGHGCLRLFQADCITAIFQYDYTKTL